MASLRSIDRDPDQPEFVPMSPVDATNGPVRVNAGSGVVQSHRGSSMGSVLRLATIISHGRSAPEILLGFGTELASLFATENFGVLMYDAERAGFSWFHDFGLQSFNIDFIPDGLGLTSAIFHSGTPELINHATADPRYWPPVEPGTGVETEHLMLAPIAIEHEPVGLMIVGRRGDAPFSREDFELFLVITEMTAGALRSARTLDSLADERDGAVESLQALSRVVESNRVVAMSPSIDELIRVVMRELRALVPCRTLTMIRLADGETPLARTTDRDGTIALIENAEHLIQHPIVARAIESGQIELWNDLDTTVPGFGGARSLLDTEHLLVVPIEMTGSKLGAVVLTRIGEKRFEPIDANVVRSLIMHGAVKGRSLRLLETARESARREQRSRERVEAILATTRAIVSWHDLPQVIAAVADLLQRQVAHDRFLALAVDEAGHGAIRHYRHAGRQIRTDLSIDIKTSALRERLSRGAMGVYGERLISQLGIDGPDRGSRLKAGGTLIYTIESPERVVGAVLLERTSGAAFNEEEQGTFEALSGLVAVAYQTASFFDEERRGRSDADLLAEAGATLSDVPSLDELSARIAGLIQRASGAQSSWCVLIDEAQASVTVRAAGGRPYPVGAGMSAGAAEAIALAAARVSPLRDQPHDIDQLRSWLDDPAVLDGAPGDMIGLPLSHDGMLRGMVLVWGSSGHAAGRSGTGRLCAAVMDLSRSALSRALIRGEAEQRIRELNAMSRLNQLAATTGATASAFCAVGAEIAMELTNARSAIAAIGPSAAASEVVRDGSEPLFDCAWVETHWATAQVSRAAFEVNTPRSAERSAATHLVLPIVADEELLGLMVLSRTDGRFSARDSKAVGRIAGQMALGLQRINTLDLALVQRARADRQSLTLSRVLEATSLFVSIHDRAELIAMAVRLTADLVDCARIAISWQDREGDLGGVNDRKWPCGVVPGPDWERWFLEDARLSGAARRYTDLRDDQRLSFEGLEIDQLVVNGVHVLVTPIGGDGSGSGAIAYTRLGGVPFSDDEFAALRIYAAELTAALGSARLIGRNRELLVSGIRALVSAVDAKDSYTRGHSERVSRLARAIAAEMDMPAHEIDTVELAGLLHDFGKIGVPDAILHKPGKLTAAERVIMMRHAGLGADMLAGVDSEAMSPLVPLVRHHHEWVNGSGYPDGLIGEQIPLGAAIISVADAYDTMTTDRPYRSRISHRQAMAELNRSVGRQFSVPVVEALESLAGRGEIARIHGPELDAQGVVARLPLAVDQSRPIEDARALKLLLDMIPMTHLIADSAVFYQQVVDLVRKSLDLPQISLYLTNDNTGRLARIANSGDAGLTVPPQQPLAVGIRGAALRSRRFRVVGDVRLDPAYDPGYDPASGSMLLTPLIVDETVIGLLSAEAAEPEALDPMNQPVLQVVADQIGSAVRLAQLHAEAQTAALTDPLTGLGNHRAFWTELDVAVAAGEPFAAIMMDVEGLKRINDSLGHLAGDALLRRVGAKLRAASGEHDLAARLGGDEFAMVVRTGDTTRGELLAAAVRRELLDEATESSGRTTIRYGVANFPADGERARDLVAVADGRLYAKMNRRDRQGT